MRRVVVLVALIAIDIWLIGSSGRNTQMVPGLTATVAAQNPTHLACVNGQCQPVDGCGPDDCSGCTGCDAQQRMDCISWGWTWDESTCTCCAPGCDPNARMDCIYQGGQWDDWSCSCSIPCNPGPPVVVGSTEYTVIWCMGDGTGYGLLACTYTYRDYVQFCQDGSVYDSWSEADPYPSCYYFCYECPCNEEPPPHN